MVERYLQERPLFRQCCPQQSLFVNPIFNLQHYAPGGRVQAMALRLVTISDEASPCTVDRVLAWILYCNDVDEAGTEFHWQDHHEPAEAGVNVGASFGLQPSHIHRGRVLRRRAPEQIFQLIATGWINAGRQEDYLVERPSRQLSSLAGPLSAWRTWSR